MKKLLVLVAAVLTGSAAFSQTLELSTKGSYRSTWLFNENLSNLGDEQDYDAGWGYNFGAGTAFYFNNSLGIEVNGLFGQFNGNYQGVVDTLGDYTSQVTLKTIDIPLLFKLRTKSKGAYLEIGPQYTMISSVKYRLTGDSSSVPSKEVTDSYKDNNLSIMLGFGVNIEITKRLNATAGIRLEYGIGDLEGVDALGESFMNPFRYKEYKSTWTAAGGLFAGVAYTFGKVDDSGSTTTAPAP